MKKIITMCAMGALFTNSLSADFIRVEAGTGIWNQTPSGYAQRTDGDGVLNLDGRYDSNEVESTETYAWIFIKHPVPIVPNLRIEYVSISDEGKTMGSVGGLEIPLNVGAPTTIDMKQYDIIPYYNLLDNTFWATIDVGLDLKIIESDVKVATITTPSAYGVSSTTFTGYSTQDTSYIPFLYLRTRAEIPTTDLGVEAEIKYIGYGPNSVYDVSAKVDYTFDIFPVVQPAIEIGYRVQQVTIDDGDDAQVDLKYAGLYGGLMVRF